MACRWTIVLAAYFTVSSTENWILFGTLVLGPGSYSIPLEEPSNLMLSPFVWLTHTLSMPSVLAIGLFYAFAQFLAMTGVYLLLSRLLVQEVGHRDWSVTLAALMGGFVYGLYPAGTVYDAFLSFGLMAALLPFYLLALLLLTDAPKLDYSILAALILTIVYLVTYDPRTILFLVPIGFVYMLLPSLTKKEVRARRITLYFLHIVIIILLSIPQALSTYIWAFGEIQTSAVVPFVKEAFLYDGASFINTFQGKAFAFAAFASNQISPSLGAFGLIIGGISLSSLLLLGRIHSKLKLHVTASAVALVMAIAFFVAPNGNQNIFLQIAFSSQFISLVHSLPARVAMILFRVFILFRTPRFLDWIVRLTYSIMSSVALYVVAAHLKVDRYS